MAIDGEQMPILKAFCSICNPHSHCGINAFVEKGQPIGVEGTDKMVMSNRMVISSPNSRSKKRGRTKA